MSRTADLDNVLGLIADFVTSEGENRGPIIVRAFTRAKGGAQEVAIGVLTVLDDLVADPTGSGEKLEILRYLIAERNER